MRKNHFFKPVFLLLSFLALTSCDNNEPLEGEFGSDDPTAESSFMVEVDGKTFIADQASATTQQGTTFISGIRNNGETVGLIFIGEGTGDYTLGGTASGGGGTYIAGSNTIPYTTSEDATGTVTVTDYNIEEGLISGTFSYIASRTVTGQDGSEETQEVNLTEGTFTNIALETDAAPGEDDDESPNAVFEVELDGELFTGLQISGNYNEDGLYVEASNTNKTIGFQIFNPQVGSFDLGNEEEALVVYDPDVTDVEGPAYVSLSGTINITSFDETGQVVSGNFEGFLQEVFGSTANVEMTNGIFENISFTTEDPTNYAAASIDGNDFNANVFPVVFVNQTIQVTFDNDLDKRIGIIFPDNIEEGTYSITAGPAEYSATYTEETGGSETVYSSIPGSGEIVITSVIDDVVTGSFNFQAEASNGDTVTVSQGEFTIDVSF